MSSDKASPQTSELPDSVLRAHEGIEHQNRFEEVGVSFVTGGGRSDASPFSPIWVFDVIRAAAKAVQRTFAMAGKPSCDFRREQNETTLAVFLRRTHVRKRVYRESHA
jgi:hypothetical protein